MEIAIGDFNTEYAECKGKGRHGRNRFCSLLKFTSNRGARIRMTQADGTGLEGGLVDAPVEKLGARA